MKDEKMLYARAISKWGEVAQITMAIEECGELVVAIAKYGRNTNGVTRDKILGEMADVDIMIKQLKMIFDYDFDGTSTVFEVLRRGKLKRLEKRLE